MKSKHSTELCPQLERLPGTICLQKRHEFALNRIPPSPFIHPCLLPIPTKGLVDQKARERRTKGGKEGWYWESRPTTKIARISRQFWKNVEGPWLLSWQRPKAWQQRRLHQCNLGSWSSPGIFHRLLCVHVWSLDHWVFSSSYVHAAWYWWGSMGTN